jgi:hypothetical protein
MVTLRDGLRDRLDGRGLPSSESGGASRDRRLARASLQLPGLARGLAFFEEFVHDLGAGGDDRS